jgi:hypothetical protein
LHVSGFVETGLQLKFGRSFSIKTVIFFLRPTVITPQLGNKKQPTRNHKNLNRSVLEKSIYSSINQRQKITKKNPAEQNEI